MQGVDVCSVWSRGMSAILNDVSTEAKHKHGEISGHTLSLFPKVKRERGSIILIMGMGFYNIKHDIFTPNLGRQKQV